MGQRLKTEKIAFSDKLRDIAKRMPEGVSRQSAESGAHALIRAGVNSIPALVSLLENNNASTSLRSTACWFAGRLGQKRLAPALLVAFRSEDVSLTRQAASDLSLLRARRVLPALISELLSAPAPEVREAAAYALRGYFFEQHIDNRILAALIRVVGNPDEHPGVRGQAAESLARSRSKRACNPLIRALSDPSAEVRFWAAFALGQIRCQAALPHLRRLARSDRRRLRGWWTVSKEAADAINQIRYGPGGGPRPKQRKRAKRRAK
jgi:HEAT repeat protein